MKTNTWLKVGLVATTAVFFAGCAGMGGSQRHRTTNLSAYLYPAQTGPVEAGSNTVLSLPLHVGIAFVPADNATNRAFAYAAAGPDYANAGANGVNYSWSVEQPLSESEKLDLMKQITRQFDVYPSIKSADVIPGDYLSPRGGFANLDRIRAMNGVDVVILLSYDQAQYTDEGAMTLSYWTIVGAYVVPAEKIDTKTVLAASVYDIVSRKLLFRASGEADVKGSSTPVNLSEQLRVDSKKSFGVAVTNLVGKLNIEIADFEKQVTTTPTQYTIQHKPGSTDAGVFGETK